MSAVFLTVEDVAQLTGYRRPTAQIRWLRSRAIRHWVNGAGHPVVPRSSIDPGADILPMPQRPNLAAIRRKA